MKLGMGDDFFKSSDLWESDLSTREMKELKRRFPYPLAQDVTQGCSNHIPEAATLDVCQAQSSQAAALPVPSLSHFTHAQCSEAAEISLTLQNYFFMHNIHPKGILHGALVFIWWDEMQD